MSACDPRRTFNRYDLNQNFKRAVGGTRVSVVFMRAFILYLALGLSLLPLAALTGLVANPAWLKMWGFALLLGLTISFKHFLAATYVGIVFAAKFAWPVTCITFPVAALVLPRKGAYDIAIFAALGAVAGPISVYTMMKLGWAPLTNISRDGRDLMWMGCVSGTILGAIFGNAIWRINRPVRSLSSSPI